MAKKEKNGTKSKGKTTAHQTNSSGDNGASLASQSTNKIETVELPENGWICEKDEAAKAVKCERNEENILRLARAYYKLRQWGKLEALTSSALKDDSGSTDNSSSKLYRQQLTTWHKEAKDNLSIRTIMDEQGYGLEESRLRRLRNINTVTCPHETFNNLNILQYAALKGDIRLLEKAIALGAVIDYPVGEPEEEYVREAPGEAPRGATALLLACSSLAMYGAVPQEHARMIFREQPRLADMLRGNLECAVQLVKLGANCSAVYRLGNCERMLFGMMQSLGIDNKNAYELAQIAKKVELTRTMKGFKSVEDRIRLVHCRCGSRLPWRECHASAALALGPHYAYYNSKVDERGGEKVLCWRFSPLGNCPCDNNKGKFKSYFKCCWQDASEYQDDSTAERFETKSMPIDERGFNALQKLMEGKGPNDLVFPPSMTNEKIFSGFRNMPLKEFIKQTDPDGISVLYGWDMEVYVSVMERLENWFQWNDLHWPIPKSELIQRTKEWNQALLQYCDDQNLAGTEREEVIKIHTASALAPCANPACNKFELDVKSFAKCSRCKKVAYCSRACQGDHWKLTHKQKCRPA
uniref:phytol kinase n=1 Tax=Attheya septentrionalis TaxID=420275 RepID=A0A7S2XN94_9STRA|mmetsp:Transcript_15632/g.28420  ORF Transcript_15632/g.28420 Transcript_15632/m.28420 type:complete len:581 (+) Transcript_15632:196-1938(+)|eukprot:CAMPEP_0198288880 /NCGR_PEP_ID=MMETSP1449-20131203/7248_1 /TAXON_ID=420275 /ORGANISM="Attheya septentrionalis, Strain CCMP2084" /LENGTH=580 /DNA_ID=CAMNT_0043987111 /DNA_START=124 /DNA_END=1866 /DNA_ORIENTATION=-